jgi:hypothetical protein
MNEGGDAVEQRADEHLTRRTGRHLQAELPVFAALSVDDLVGGD